MHIFRRPKIVYYQKNTQIINKFTTLFFICWVLLVGSSFPLIKNDSIDSRDYP